MLSEERIERYARHILLREVGGGGQSRLLASSVHLEGLGGVGEWAAAYLALAGVGSLGLEDRPGADDALAGPIVGAGQGAKAAALAEVLGAYNPDPVVQVGARGAQAPSLAETLGADNPDPVVQVGARVGPGESVKGEGATVESSPEPCLVATLESGEILEVRLLGDRFTLAWTRPGEGLRDCGRCLQVWFEQADPAQRPALATVAGSLAAGEILGRTLGISTVPEGIRWFVGGLPIQAPSCTHR